MTLQDYFYSYKLLEKNELEKVIWLAYFVLQEKGKKEFAISDINGWFNELDLSKPNASRLAKNLAKSRKIVTLKGSYKLHASAISEITHAFGNKKVIKSGKNEYIDTTRINELKGLPTDKFDFIKLIKLCEELNSNYSNSNYLTVAMLCRTIIDHVPPIFGMSSFSEVANNYVSTKSFKDSMLNLSNSARKIGDSYLHTQIRKKEVLPSKTQVDFSNDLDILLSEIVRIMK